MLSDFGSRDHYVGTMKGVLLGICPDVTLVDITHDIAPHDVLDGALELAAAYRYFPAGTIFLAVVDPGVGSVRRGIAAEAGPGPSDTWSRNRRGSNTIEWMVMIPRLTASIVENISPTPSFFPAAAT